MQKQPGHQRGGYPTGECSWDAHGEDALRVEAVVSVDERGQMVLPKEVRTLAGIRAGEKLAVVSYQHGGSICCLWLMKTEQLLGSVRRVLGPLAEELSAGGGTEEER